MTNVSSHAIKHFLHSAPKTWPMPFTAQFPFVRPVQVRSRELTHRHPPNVVTTTSSSTNWSLGNAESIASNPRQISTVFQWGSHNFKDFLSSFSVHLTIETRNCLTRCFSMPTRGNLHSSMYLFFHFFVNATFRLTTVRCRVSFTAPDQCVLLS